MKLRLQQAGLIGCVAISFASPTTAQAPQPCKPGPITKTRVSSHVVKAAPLKVEHTKHEDMFYVRVQLKVQESLYTRDDQVKMATDSIIHLEVSCIDLKSDSQDPAPAGYCPDGKGIRAQGAVESPDGYSIGEPGIFFLGSRTQSPKDAKIVWSDSANLPFQACEDSPGSPSEEEAKVRAFKRETTPAPEPKPAPTPKPAAAKSGCS